MVPALADGGGPDHTAGGGELAEVPQAFEDGAVLAHVEAHEEVQVLVQVVRGHCFQEIDVVLRVVFDEVVLDRQVRDVPVHHLQVVQDLVTIEQRVSHTDTVRLHWVAWTIEVITDVVVVVIQDSHYVFITN